MGQGVARAGRGADPQRARDPRAAVQEEGTCRLLVGCVVVGRLRATGDAGRPVGGRRFGDLLVTPDLDCHRGAAGSGRLQLPPDHLRLSEWRRQLHRRAREPGRDPGPDRRGRPLGRLHPDRLGLDRFSGRPAGLGGPAARLASDFAGYRGRRAGDACQPARHSRVGQHLRRADVRVPRGHVHVDRRWPVSVLHRAVLRSAAARAAAAHRAVDPVLAAARVRRWLGGHDRHRGDLQRHTRLQTARVAQRGAHDRDHGRHPRGDVPWPVISDRGGSDHPTRRGDRHLAAGARGLRQRSALLRSPDLGRADSRAGGQHRLRRLPAPGLTPGARRLRAQAVRIPR